jgi:hypothetical protein
MKQKLLNGEERPTERHAYNGTVAARFIGAEQWGKAANVFSPEGRDALMAKLTEEQARYGRKLEFRVNEFWNPPAR